jgi:DnaJ family protein C protein 28
MSSSKRVKRQQEERLERLKRDLEERQLPEQDPAEAVRARRERERADLIERRIQEAMANGDFDNLRGHGQPFRFNTNPYLNPAQELAFGLLQNNGLAPDWIERDKEIRREVAAARERLRLAWQQYQAHPASEASWQVAVTQFAGALVKLNRQIDDFNLIVPLPGNQRFRLRLEDELRRVQGL